VSGMSEEIPRGSPTDPVPRGVAPFRRAGSPGDSGIRLYPSPSLRRKAGPIDAAGNGRMPAIPVEGFPKMSLGPRLPFRRRHSISLVLFALALSPFLLAAAGASPLKPEEAVQHIGETATVCGSVASAKHADTTRGQGTFLHLDKPYPHQIFTVIIWEKVRPAFGEPEKSLMHKRICVTGMIQAYKGKPEIQPSQPSQVREEPPR
jgi:hypothetical protein